MKRLGMLLAVVLVLTILMPTVATAQENDHQIKNKWDFSGTFVALSGYDWDGMADEATWTYKIHIKEAMNGELSSGSVHFTTGDIDVIGNVRATKREYDHWSGSTPNIAAVGKANYNDTIYYFMFLYAEDKIWFALSTTSYDSYWGSENVWPNNSTRAYQLHSVISAGQFGIEYKTIHD
ncbi:hypothetical protein ACFLWZ_09035 [Chloroflexota bacterium]